MPSLPGQQEIPLEQLLSIARAAYPPKYAPRKPRKEMALALAKYTYSCPVCLTKFHLKLNLREHLKIEHKLA